MTGKVLLADDEHEMHALLSPVLQREGLSLIHAYTGPEAIDLARREEPDLILLDVMLPGLDGFEVCREIRRSQTMPILFLSARGEEFDKVLGLGVGGDDYVTKPFSPMELAARVKAHLRRRQRFDAPPAQPDPAAPVRAGELVIDPGRAEVHLSDGRIAVLTARELGVLLALARSPGRIYTKKQLYEAAWDAPYFGDDNTVMVTIRRLREKVEIDPDRPTLILTVRGLGYKLAGSGEVRA